MVLFYSLFYGVLVNKDVERGGGKWRRGGFLIYIGGTLENPINTCFYFSSSAYLLVLFNFCSNFSDLFLAIYIALEGFYYYTIL